MIQQSPAPKRKRDSYRFAFRGRLLCWSTGFPTLAATEDFEGTEDLLRHEVAEGWQEPKGEVE